MALTSLSGTSQGAIFLIARMGFGKRGVWDRTRAARMRNTCGRKRYTMRVRFSTFAAGQKSQE